MRKILAVFLILTILSISAFSSADIIYIDTETATVEEVRTAISKLNDLFEKLSKNVDGLPKTVTFSNGSAITVDSFDVNKNNITIHFSFVHQNNEPLTWNINVICKAYQNGKELNAAHTANDASSMTKTVLAGGEGKVSLTFSLRDKTDVTLCIYPLTTLTNWTNEYEYISLKID